MQDRCNADKSIRMKHYINRMKENNHKFTLIDEERAFRKKLISIHDENSKQMWQRRNLGLHFSDHI